MGKLAEKPNVLRYRDISEGGASQGLDRRQIDDGHYSDMADRSDLLSNFNYYKIISDFKRKEERSVSQLSNIVGRVHHTSVSPGQIPGDPGQPPSTDPISKGGSHSP